MENERVFQFDTLPEDLTVDELVRKLGESGYSNTCARRAVLEALIRAGGPLSPAELVVAGRAVHRALGLVTVYRTLEILEGLGLVRRLHLNEGCHSYALSAAGLQSSQHSEHDGGPRHPHHIICEECNRAVEFAGCDIDSVILSVQAQTGFTVRNHWLEMFGVCPACQEQRS